MNCQHEEAVVIAIRAAKDEPTTGTVVCNECGEKWPLGSQPAHTHLVDHLGNDWETG